MTPSPLHLFDAVGIEIEYMIVDQETLDVRPIADQLFEAILGYPDSDVPGPIASWSNELVNHVIELKTTRPVASIAELHAPFQAEIDRMNSQLRDLSALLMPTAMHPWMNPKSETVLWPLENNDVYQTYDRIFDCKGPGWSNLQSVHLNLPFSGDDEFERLHTAIRVIIGLLPALAASSPFELGQPTGWLDTRMKYYETNSARIPEVAGSIVPEFVTSEAEYIERILNPMYAAIAPHDPENILREEWLNARGAIARFSRGSIEIRVLDSQDCITGDLALAELVTAVVRALAEERWSNKQTQRSCQQEALVACLKSTAQLGERATVTDADLLRCFGLPESPRSAGDVWQYLLADLVNDQRLSSESAEYWQAVLPKGTLSARLLAAADQPLKRPRLTSLYRTLADRLATSAPFIEQPS